MSKRKVEEMKTEVQIITPDQAREWLGKTQRQRALSQKRMEAISHAIRAGNWQVNGETIIISAAGEVLDGQHRLRACIEADMPIRSVVCLGVDSAAIDTIDTGASRRIADVLHIEGMAQPGHYVTIAALMLRVKQWHSDGFFSSYYPPRADTLALIRGSHEALAAYISMFWDFRKVGLANPAAMVATLAYIAKWNPSVSDFAAQLISGENLKKGDPVYTLRERSLRDARSRTGRQGDREMWQTIVFTISAWSAWLHDEQLQRFSPRADEFGRPLFPVLYVSENRTVKTPDATPRASSYTNGWKRAAE